MRLEPIGLDYLLPTWVARLAEVLAVLALAGVMFVAIDVARSGRKPVKDILALAGAAGTCAAVIYRARKVIPRLRDETFRLRITKYRQLTGITWDEMMDRLVADADAEIGEEHTAVLAHPTTWGRKQRILSVVDHNLSVELIEHNDCVGRVRLALIVQR